MEAGQSTDDKYICFPFMVDYEDGKGRYCCQQELIYGSTTVVVLTSYRPHDLAHLFKILFRYLVASRDIAAGEVIMIDHPYVQGPPAKSLPHCLQCTKYASEDSYRCSK